MIIPPTGNIQKMGLAYWGLVCLKSVHIKYERSFFIAEFTGRISKKGGTAAK